MDALGDRALVAGNPSPLWQALATPAVTVRPGC
jgi:hypothetical protein